MPKKTPKSDQFNGLSAAQIEVAEGLSRGLAPAVLAARTGSTEKDVMKWMKDPKFNVALQMFRAGAVNFAVQQRSAREILEQAAPQAADTVVGMMYSPSAKDSDRLHAAESVLDRTGHAKQTEVKKTVTVLDADAVRLIEETRRMMLREQIPEANYEILPTQEKQPNDATPRQLEGIRPKSKKRSDPPRSGGTNTKRRRQGLRRPSGKRPPNDGGGQDHPAGEPPAGSGEAS